MDEVGEEANDGVLEDESVNEVFSPVPATLGPSSRRMSPKRFSVSFNAISCGTPAKATTILSGLKKVERYFSITSLLMYGSRSCGL